MLSVVIITKNEAHNIEDCLQSVQFADEIIVIDNSSCDDTVALAGKYTPNVFITQDWPGFGPQKNRALQHANGDWILSLDADERISKALEAEILDTIKNDHYDACYIPRSSQYCGRQIRYSGWYPDYVLRLFKREGARFSDDIVHEKVIVPAGTRKGKLQHAIIHHSFVSMEQVVDKMNHYSSANARKAFEQGKRSSLTRAIAHGIWAFFRTYILRLGFLDGREGFMLAFSNAEGTYYRYVKLLFLHQNLDKNKNTRQNN